MKYLIFIVGFLGVYILLFFTLIYDKLDNSNVAAIAKLFFIYLMISILFAID
jgi:hypothetical protein